MRMTLRSGGARCAVVQSGAATTTE